MYEFKQSITRWAPVRVVDSSGNPVTGVAYTAASGSVQKSDGSVANFTIGSGDWIEATTGAFSGTGVYAVQIPAAAFSLTGMLTYAVATTGNATYIGSVKVVANEEVDTYSRVGAPVGASISADVAAVPDTVWDEALAGHVTAGTAGKVLGDISSPAIADAVWDELLSGHTTAGSAGKTLGDVDVSTVAAAVWDVPLASHLTAGTTGKSLSDTGGSVTTLKKYEEGRWKIHTSGGDANRLVLYDTDGTTAILKFDLKDAAGDPTYTNPFERVKVP